MSDGIKYLIQQPPEFAALEMPRDPRNSQLPALPIGPSFSEIENLVILWGYNRKIIPNSNSLAQASKAVEELNGELIPHAAQLALLRQRLYGNDPVEEKEYVYLHESLRATKEKLKDDIGDVLVCLTMICELEDLSLTECFAAAYNDIKDRTGEMRADGKFHKS